MIAGTAGPKFDPADVYAKLVQTGVSIKRIRRLTDWQIVRLYSEYQPPAETPDDSDDLDVTVARMRAMAVAFNKDPDEAEAAVRRAASAKG